MPSKIENYYSPTALYRYRSLDSVSIDKELDALKFDYIFCPQYDELNDPMEAKHRVSRLLQRSLRYPEIAAQLEEKVRALGVASFSESRLIEPMWAYYADNFRGICVAYNVNRLSEALPEGCGLARMGYNETPPLLSLTAKGLDRRARAVLCAKTLRWSHEREWRLFAPARGPACYGSTKCVTAVYLGKRMEESSKDRLLAVLDAKSIPAHLMDIESYRLTFSKRPVPNRRLIPR